MANPAKIKIFVKVFLDDGSFVRRHLPLFPWHGSIFFQGVRFSVQTFSPGSVPLMNLLLPPSLLETLVTPLGVKLYMGDALVVRSRKLSEAHSCPESAFVSDLHEAHTSPSATPAPNQALTSAPGGTLSGA